MEVVTTAWTDSELLMLYSLKEAGKKFPEIAALMNKSPLANRGYTDNSLQKKYSQIDWVKWLSSKKEIEENAEKLSDKQQVIESTISAHERTIKRDKARTEVIADSVKSAIYRLPKPSENFYKPKSSKYSAEHAGLVLSDLHIGESFSLQDTGGLSEFNFEVFKKRMNVVKESVVEIVHRHRNIYDIPELHVFCLGDIVAGMPEVGQWSQAYIDLDIQDQLWKGVAAIRDALATWSKHFKNVHFYGIYGNHGRMARRGLLKTSTNWDHLCYRFLEQSLSEYKNITWDIPTAWFLQRNILGHEFYLTHGDGIKGSMGIPFYGVTRAESKISAMMKKRPDYFLLGHFHSAAEFQTNSSKVIMNGSFMGGDMYSLRDLNSVSAPEQKMFGIHERKGVTWTYNIHLARDQ